MNSVIVEYNYARFCPGEIDVILNRLAGKQPVGSGYGVDNNLRDAEWTFRDPRKARAFARAVERRYRRFKVTLIEAGAR